MNIVMRGAALLAALSALAGCATGADDVALVQRAQATMVGMPKAQLLSCAGVPERQAAAGGREFYTYVARNSASYGGPSTSVGVAGGSGGVGLGIGFGFPLFGSGTTPLSSSACEATVVLDGDVVQRVTVPSAGHLADCAPIVRNCVPPAP